MTAKATDRGQSPLGIVAAAGQAPLMIAHHVLASGRDVFIVLLKDVANIDGAELDAAGIPHVTHRIGKLNDIITSLKAQGCAELILCGTFKRPSFASFWPDNRAAKILMKALLVGDDEALSLIKDEVAKDGLTIIDTQKLMPSMRADEGLLAGQAASDQQVNSIKLGVQYLSASGKFDVGQTCVVQGQRIIAVEAAEGTDAMIERAGQFIDPDLSAAVLVKIVKPGQDRALDPPAIGEVTVQKVKEAGIAVIAIEAGGTVIIDAEKTIAAANAHGVTLLGLPIEELAKEGLPQASI